MSKAKFVNKMRDSASIGVQAGEVKGSVTASHSASGVEPTVDITVQLAELRRLLEAAIANGDVDPGIAPAARGGLSAAETAAADETLAEPTRRERLITGLKTLKSAVRGVTGLSDSVADLVRSVASFS